MEANGGMHDRHSVAGRLAWGQGPRGLRLVCCASSRLGQTAYRIPEGCRLVQAEARRAKASGRSLAWGQRP